MIQYRDSMAELSAVAIRERLDDIEIFRRYCPGFVRPGQKFRSPLRRDPRPSVTISPSTAKPGCYWYMDFGYPEHSFDSISFVMVLHNMTYREAMLRIDSDFGLGLSGGVLSEALTLTRPVHRKLPCQIQFRIRKWNRDDSDYWGQFLLTQRDLLRARVFPIDYYWINGFRTNADPLCYAFLCNSPSVKIYSPLSTSAKWWSNTSVKDVQAMHLLPAKGRDVVITSSLKDAMCLMALGITAVAPQSESAPLSPQLIQRLTGFQRVHVLYDSDMPGMTYGEALSTRHGFNWILLPFGPYKDVAEMIECEGPVRTSMEIRSRFQ